MKWPRSYNCYIPMGCYIPVGGLFILGVCTAPRETHCWMFAGEGGGLLTSIVSIFKHSERRHSLVQGHLQYVMHTFELKSPKVQKCIFLLGFLCRKRFLACYRSGLFNFHLLFAPVNCLEIV